MFRIVAGTTSATGTFTLTPTQDTVVEGSETLSVSGTTTESDLTDGVTGTTVTLSDDDGSAEVTIEDDTAEEGEELAFTVTLDKAVEGGFTVTPSFTDGTATKGSDYTENPRRSPSRARQERRRRSRWRQSRMRRRRPVRRSR